MFLILSQGKNMTCSTTAGFEKHDYAPGLNRLHYANGTVIEAPGILSVNEYRQKVIGKPWPFMIMAEVKTIYPEKHRWHERKKVGCVASRKEAIEFRKKVQDLLAPGCKTALRTWIVGL
jgi:hypothetical protein